MALRYYWQLTNPNIVSLLVFTAVTSSIMAGGLKQPIRLTEVALAVTLSSMGARTLTNYIDRDIDLLMNRTRHRPLPAGLVTPSFALIYGLTLSSIGVLLASPLGIFYPFILLFGLLDNVVVYNALTKRRTAWNIILGSPSGGVPAFLGYIAITQSISFTPFILAAIVVLWTPIHIWSLAIKYKDDYERAGVPMLPVVFGVKSGIRCIASTSILLALFTILLPFVPGSTFGKITLATSVVLAIPLLYMSFRLIRDPNEKHAWTLFKFTSPYLAILFTMLAIDSIL